MIHLVDLSPEQATELFTELQPYIVRALAFDPLESITLGEVFDQVGNGSAKVVIAADDHQMLSATVIQLFRTAAGEKVVHVLATAGDRSRDWLPMLTDHLDDLGRAEGATALTMSGRPGWTRKLTQYGFKTAHVFMRREINGRDRQVNAAGAESAAAAIQQLGPDVRGTEPAAVPEPEFSERS